MLPTKKRQRKPRFAPPPVPKTEDLKAHQCYGVITGYHGGIRRDMDVTIYDAVTNDLKNVRCKLKGSLRHSKCKQQIIIGSLVVTDYEDVIIIFTSSQHSAVPDNIYRKLVKHHDALKGQAQGNDDLQAHQAHQAHQFNDHLEEDQDDFDDDLPSRRLNNDDDDDAVIFDADADADLVKEDSVNIDLI